MAMINCPECGNLVSDKAITCIHCGVKLAKEKNILRIKTPYDPRVLAVLTYKFIDKQTGTVLGQAHQNEVIEFEIDTPTTIVCHFGRGWKDCELNYVPNGIQKYTISQIKGCFKTSMNFVKIDVIDSD